MVEGEFDVEEILRDVCAGNVEESINEILDRNYYENMMNDDISKILRGALTAQVFEKV